MEYILSSVFIHKQRLSRPKSPYVPRPPRHPVRMYGLDSIYGILPLILSLILSVLLVVECLPREALQGKLVCDRLELVLVEHAVVVGVGSVEDGGGRRRVNHFFLGRPMVIHETAELFNGH